MKKFVKLAAVLAALVLALSCFVACSNGDDDDDDSPSVSKWVTEDGEKLTVKGEDSGSYILVSGNNTFEGTFKVTATVNGVTTGTLDGDVVGNYTIDGDKMTVIATSPDSMMLIFTNVDDFPKETEDKPPVSGSSPSVSKSTWVSTNSDTLTVSDDGTYKFVSNGKTYNGTYKVTASAGGTSTGTLAGDVVGNYTIYNGTMTILISSPEAMSISLTQK